MKKTILLLSLIFLSGNLFAYRLNITELGAKGDGVTDNTTLIQQAIDLCSENRGTVVIPQGTFLTRSIFLKSNVSVHLDKDAILLGSTDLQSYYDAFPDKPGKGTPALIFAQDKENIAISGQGKIDGQGGHKNFQQGDDSEGGLVRPKIIYFIGCKNVKVEDITLVNSAYWVQDYERCDGVMIKGIKVFSQCNWNNDGLDIDSKNVIVSDCYINSGDDALCLKSDTKEFCENVTITNCILKSNCNAIKFGTASMGGFKNINISNCVILKPDEDRLRQWHLKYPWMGVTEPISTIAGIAIESVDGGTIDQISISNINMSGVQTPIFIRLGDRRQTFSGNVSTLKNVSINQIIASSLSKVACSITGVPDSYVENVMISNVLLNTPGGGTSAEAKELVPENIDAYPENRMFGVVLPASGFYVRHAKGISFNNVRLNTAKQDARPMFFVEDVKELSISNCLFNGLESTIKGDSRKK